jgi:hypothetical protein
MNTTNMEQCKISKNTLCSKMISETPSIWMCPASTQNLNVTIKNTYQGENCWALNGTKTGENKFNKMRKGDICIFGDLLDGYNYYGIVKEKQILSESESLMWTFRSESGTIWKHKFVVENIKKCNISPEKAKYFRGWTKKKQTWQTQIMLKRGEGYEEFYSFIASL